ncbi:MAG: oxaloacetate decarboxylase [Bacteroidales bacterium]|nr:oxaloacetate decarboxylase [Bacteroidales bacterium]
MGREVKLSLVFRDMWQSAGKYQPRVDQLMKVAPAIVRMGCFDRVETNGGGFEQVNLLYGENPNIAVRQWTKPFHEAGIQTHMLDRGLNGLRMSPCSADLRRLFYKVKKAQGTDITRIFDGLNDPRNVLPSIRYAKEAGMIAQASLCLTHSPVHTAGYFIKLGKQFIEAGADEICLKDMAGIGRPVTLGKIVKGIKEAYPEIPIQYHTHSGPGFSMASILEVCQNGCDYVDTAMSPLSWGTGHPDVIAVQEMLRDAGFEVKDINMDAYMEARSLIQEMYDDFLGYYCPEYNRLDNSLLIKPGLPGGMMGSLMTDLEDNLSSLNKWKVKNGQEELTTDQLMVKLFDEVAYVWPKVGYPPLVTPFSQYVKNLALFNVISLEKGKQRWEIFPDTVWDMVLGKTGRLPGPVDEEIKALAAAQGREFTDADPQGNYPDCLEDYRRKMAEKGWACGEDDEELFEYAMHPQQYEAFRSGKAKADFEADLARRKEERNAPSGAGMPSVITLSLNGMTYKLDVAYGDAAPVATTAAASAPAGAGEDLTAPLSGKFFLTKDTQEKPKKVGDPVKKGETLCYIEAMKVQNAVAADFDGVITAILKSNGDTVEEDEPILKIAKN